MVMKMAENFDEWENDEDDSEKEEEEKWVEGWGKEEEPEQQPSEDDLIRAQKKRIYDKIEAQVDLSDFWQTVLATPAWSDILRIYYRLCSGIVKKYYASFTVQAVLVGEKIEWKYTFFDSNGKEIDFDILNEAGVKE